MQDPTFWRVEIRDRQDPVCSRSPASAVRVSAVATSANCSTISPESCWPATSTSGKRSARCTTVAWSGLTSKPGILLPRPTWWPCRSMRKPLSCRPIGRCTAPLRAGLERSHGRGVGQVLVNAQARTVGRTKLVRRIGRGAEEITRIVAGDPHRPRESVRPLAEKVFGYDVSADSPRLVENMLGVLADASAALLGFQVIADVGESPTLGPARGLGRGDAPTLWLRPTRFGTHRGTFSRESGHWSADWALNSCTSWVQPGIRPRGRTLAGPSRVADRCAHTPTANTGSVAWPSPKEWNAAPLPVAVGYRGGVDPALPRRP